MTKKELKSKHEYAVNKAFCILSEGNPINVLKISILMEKLRSMELADLGIIIASQYSPEGNTKWQDILAA